LKLPNALRGQAECRPINGVTLTHLFFGETVALQGQAKTYCLACPILLPCLKAGLDEDAGVWGGLAEGERKKLSALIKEKGITL
jgi:hypothetical protein